MNNRKMKRLQTMIAQGIFIEDPDRLLSLSDETKALIDDLDKNERIKALMKERAKDDDDYNTGYWTCIYYQSVPEFTQQEANEAVAVFKSWEKAVAEDRLREWSMGLRLR